MPTILLKRIFPMTNAITTVNDPRIGEKNLAAVHSDFVGTLIPGRGSL